MSIPNSSVSGQQGNDQVSGYCLWILYPPKARDGETPKIVVTVDIVNLMGSGAKEETTLWANGGGKTHPKCGQHYPMDWSPGLNEKEKVS